ncbi:hypothetical protein B6I21_04285 [candidate division KSB1 bacterium 4572_119]|nr:MAG: hypothetical protein B6I21_04285 [candidate division KSB1 bacterium 4572_119]
MEGLKGFFISLFLFLLIGVNLLFAVSWVLHELQISSLKDNSTVTVFTSISPQVQSKRLKVEVFNACGEKDVARKMSEFLRDNNVDVVYYGNYLVNKNIYSIQTTLVIDRKNENASNASKIAALIGVERRWTIHQLNAEREVDVTVLIGKNFRTLKGLD